MANEAGELVVKISADVADMKAALQLLTQNVGSVGAQTVATGNLMADAFKMVGREVITFVEESIKAFAEHEQAITRLNILVGKDATQAFESYAQELQRTTAYSDDAVLSLEKQLSQYGIFPGSIKEATKALVDFSSVTGVDLPEAGHMLAQAMAGQSRALKSYGIDVSTVGTRSENLAIVTEALEGRFHNAAETMKGTTLGAVESLTNRFDDLKKRIGEDFIPVANKLIVWAGGALSVFESLINQNRKYSDSISDQKAKLTDLLEKAKAQISNHVELTKAQQDEIKATVSHIQALEKLGKAKDGDKGATDREISSIRSLKDEILKLQQEQGRLGEITSLTIQKRLLGEDLALAQMTADEQAITQITDNETAKRLETTKLAWEANASFSEQLKVKTIEDISKTKSVWVDMVGSMIDSFANATAKMIIEGGKFSDILKSMWTQLAEAVISQIIRMMAQWMVFQAMTGGTGGGFGFFGGMAEGGMIAEPSVLTGLRTGRSHLVGESGPEAVVPMNGGSGGNQVGLPRGMSADGGSDNGGANITVNISGQFVEGNPAKWQRMVQEQIAPELRRLAMKDPNSLITRKRGSNS